MAKFFGEIGYGVTEETRPGVWKEVMVKRHYYGDVLQYYRRWESKSGQLNDDLNLNNKISIVADPFAYDHFHQIRYVKWGDSKWKVSNVEVQYPRLILTIGGVYNEPKQKT